MNQRINELIAKAGFVRFSPEEDPLTPIDWSCDYTKEVEKFAELLILECSKVITHGGYWSGGPLGPRRQATPPEIAKMVREHFGVEE